MRGRGKNAWLAPCLREFRWVCLADPVPLFEQFAYEKLQMWNCTILPKFFGRNVFFLRENERLKKNVLLSAEKPPKGPKTVC